MIKNFVLYLFLSLTLLISCGPREDELNAGIGGRMGAYGAEVTVEGQNEKLPSCNAEEDPTWNTVRLFEELSMIFDRTDTLKVVVSKGSRNCVKVSNSEPVEIVIKNDPSSENFTNTGHFYFVTKIEILNTANLLSNEGRLRSVSEGMNMSVDQMRAFLTQSDFVRDQITLTYLSKGEVSLEKQLVNQNNQKLSTCSDEGDPTWNSIRLFEELSFLYDKLDQLKVVIAKGDFNCVKVSDTEPVEIDLQQNGVFQGSGQLYFVEAIELVSTEEFLSNEERFAEMAAAMAMTTGELRNYLTSGPQKSSLNITYLKPSTEAVIDFDLPLGLTLVAEGEGVKLPTCREENDPVWTELDLPRSLMDKMADVQSLKQVVLFGRRNCFMVSDLQTVELVTQGDTIKISHDIHFKIKKLRLMNFEDFINNQEVLTELMERMGIAAADLDQYLTHSDRGAYITLVDLEPSEKINPIVTLPERPIDSFDVTHLSGEEHQGQTLSECSNSWSSIRVPQELVGLLQQGIDEKSITAFVTKGDFNCLPLGARAVFSLRVNNSWVDQESYFTVASLTLRPKSKLLEDPILQGFVATEMGFSRSEFLSYLESFDEEWVNVTRIIWEVLP